jgi:DNA-binding response OmpR family regulator
VTDKTGQGVFMNSATIDLAARPGEEPFDILNGLRVVVAGFTPEEATGFVTVFQTAGAFCRAVTATGLDAAARSCDLMLANLAGIEDYATVLEPITAPVIAIVSPETAADYLPWMRKSAVDCVFYPCTEKEILTRSVMAVYRRKAPSGRSPDEKLRILLADDDPAISALLKATLESDGMVCRCARTGIEALEVARAWAPDLAILDVNMPGMSGYQALSTLHRAEEPIPVLLLTSCDQESEIMKGFKLGAADYVVKPFNPMEILMRVKRIVTVAG